jgi:hypothetical protein
VTVQVAGTEQRLRSLGQERDALQAELQQLSSSIQGSETAQLLQDLQQQLLPDPQHPTQVLSPALLLPRVMTAGGAQARPAALQEVQGMSHVALPMCPPAASCCVWGSAGLCG